MTEAKLNSHYRIGRANSLAELCAFGDLDFVRCAFVTLLGRQADPDDEMHFLAQLGGGVHKLSILRQMRFSKEGQSYDPGIPGLDRALRQHRNDNLPVIGRMVRWFRRRVVGGAFVNIRRHLKRPKEVTASFLRLRRNVSGKKLRCGNSARIYRELTEGDGDWLSNLTTSLKS